MAGESDAHRRDRWSSLDDEARPGSLYNCERSTRWWDAFWYPSAIGPIVAIRQVLSGRRREDSVEIDDFAVTISVNGSVRRIPLEELAAIETDLRVPHTSGSPLLELRTRTGELVPIPDSLYPDAATEYPSLRHRNRAQDIAHALERVVAHHNADNA